MRVKFDQRCSVQCQAGDLDRTVTCERWVDGVLVELTVGESWGGIIHGELSAVPKPEDATIASMVRGFKLWVLCPEHRARFTSPAPEDG